MKKVVMFIAVLLLTQSRPLIGYTGGNVFYTDLKVLIFICVIFKG